MTGTQPTVPAAPGRTPAAGPRPDRSSDRPPARTTGRSSRPVLLSALVAGVVALLAAGSITHAFAPLLSGLGDPGAAVRFGLPIVRVVRDLAIALTTGLLVVGVMLVPRGLSSGLTGRAVRWASRAAWVWVAAGLIGIVLAYADLSGQSPQSGALWGDFAANAWSFDAFKAEFVATAGALVIAIAGPWTRSRYAAAWLMALAVAAVLPLGLSGHAAGAVSHDTGVAALTWHLVGFTVWAGGLAALVVLRSAIPAADFPVVVRRYSVLALAGFVTVGLSGLLSGWIRVGSLSSLGSTYAILLGLKAIALIVLGALGWRQRSREVAALTADPSRPGPFARLAGIEVAIMGATAGIAVALARSNPPVAAIEPTASPAQSLTGYPQPPAPTSMSWLVDWRVDLTWLTLSLVAIGLYLAGVRRLHARGDRWPVLRTVSWLVGQALFLYATQSALGIYGRVMFSWHMAMHMVLSMAVPMFLVLAAPSTLAIRALAPRTDGSFGPRELLLAMLHSRWVGFMANPVVAALNFFGSLWLFYYTPLFELALRTHTGHVLMVIHFTLAGYGFAWALIGIDPGPKKWAPPLRLLVLLVTLGFHAWFGIAIMTGRTLLAPDFYSAIQLPWVPNPLKDQQDGGGIAWGVGEFPTLLLALLVGLDWARSDGRESRRFDRAEARDDDAELRAYNERLRAMREHDRRP